MAPRLLDGCRGFPGDDSVAVTVSPDNVRQLIDTNRPNFVQSALRCRGPAPSTPASDAFGRRCDGAAAKALRCEPDLSRGSDDLLPYARIMLQPLADCQHAGKVLVLGLGGGTIPTFLQHQCPGSQVLAVDNNPNVVTAARDFFGFKGDAEVKDLHAALADLSEEKPGTFDAIVTDVGHNIHLNKEDLRHGLRLLKSDGLLMENLSTPSFAEKQLALYRDFLPSVEDVVSHGNHILLGRRTPSTLEQ
ncbi:unnamed protein product [Effrenium voratum]|uniref:Methyltransferase domain-containing protein n=1 Tax=Effrenium voratum TaxID=2562239 RepID=A0AA36JMN8_9DINO|nr:unnamed protein product [Effrenium voratum]